MPSQVTALSRRDVPPARTASSRRRRNCRNCRNCRKLIGTPSMPPSSQGLSSALLGGHGMPRWTQQATSSAGPTSTGRLADWLAGWLAGQQRAALTCRPGLVRPDPTEGLAPLRREGTEARHVPPFFSTKRYRSICHLGSKIFRRLHHPNKISRRGPATDPSIRPIAPQVPPGGRPYASQPSSHRIASRSSLLSLSSPEQSTDNATYRTKAYPAAGAAPNSRTAAAESFMVETSIPSFS